MRCVMDIKILTNRYSTPMYVKVIGTLLFPAIFILMVVLPVFEMIKLSDYANVFNINGVAKGSYDSTQYTIYTMLENDYHNGGVMVGFIIFAVLAVICGIAFLWMNRTKLAVIPASVLFVEVIFSIFRSPDAFYDAKHVADFWQQSINAGFVQNCATDDATGYVARYFCDGTADTVSANDLIFNRMGQYWVLWIAAIVLMAFCIFGVVKTKTLIEKKK